MGRVSSGTAGPCVLTVRPVEVVLWLGWLAGWLVYALVVFGDLSWLRWIGLW